jgi:hypothetical protein
MKQISFLFFSVFITSILSGQDEYESALIPMKDGAVFAFTSDKKSFTLDILSNKIQPLEQKNFVMIDDWIFQAFVLGFDNPKNVDLTTEEEQKRSLSQYVKYEVDYYKNEVGYSCDSLKFEWGKINEKYFYFWYFNTPPELETLQKQMFLTTICHDQFLNMNIPLEKTKDFNKGKDFLVGIAKTLKLYDNPINFKKLNKELNK